MLIRVCINIVWRSSFGASLHAVLRLAMPCSTCGRSDSVSIFCSNTSLFVYDFAWNHHSSQNITQTRNWRSLDNWGKYGSCFAFKSIFDNLSITKSQGQCSTGVTTGSCCSAFKSIRCPLYILSFLSCSVGTICDGKEQTVSERYSGNSSREPPQKDVNWFVQSKEQKSFHNAMGLIVQLRDFIGLTPYSKWNTAFTQLLWHCLQQGWSRSGAYIVCNISS